MQEGVWCPSAVCIWVENVTSYQICNTPNPCWPRAYNLLRSSVMHSDCITTAESKLLPLQGEENGCHLITAQINDGFGEGHSPVCKVFHISQEKEKSHILLGASPPTLCLHRWKCWGEIGSRWSERERAAVVFLCGS